MLIGTNLPKVGLLMSITLIGGGAAIMYFEQGQDSFKNFFLRLVGTGDNYHSWIWRYDSSNSGGKADWVRAHTIWSNFNINLYCSSLIKFRSGENKGRKGIANDKIQRSHYRLQSGEILLDRHSSLL